MKNYLSLVKFSHTIFALPFAIIGFALAIYPQYVFFKGPGWRNNIGDTFPLTILSTEKIILKLLLVIVCMVTARNAAMAFNRWLDASFDALNPRTAIREIPSGLVRKESALIFVIINCGIFMIASFLLNQLCFWLSPVALFVILFYSYTKRFTALCHLVLGLGLALAPVGAFIAVTGKFYFLPILFGAAVLFWVSGFDIIYALQDEEFDKSIQLHSIPVLLGKQKALIASRILHLISFGLLVAAGLQGPQFGLFYWFGVTLFGLLLIRQHSLVKPTDLSKVNAAFFTSNGIASVSFAILVLMDLFL